MSLLLAGGAAPPAPNKPYTKMLTGVGLAWFALMMTLGLLEALHLWP